MAKFATETVGSSETMVRSLDREINVVSEICGEEKTLSAVRSDAIERLTVARGDDISDWMSRADAK